MTWRQVSYHSLDEITFSIVWLTTRLIVTQETEALSSINHRIMSTFNLLILWSCVLVEYVLVSNHIIFFWYSTGWSEITSYTHRKNLLYISIQGGPKSNLFLQGHGLYNQPQVEIELWDFVDPYIMSIVD